MQSLNPSILITDDDRAFRETLREVFEPRGFRTFLAGDGDEALEILRGQLIHVAVFDMHMPRLDGLRTIQKLREFQLSIPCILLSAALDEQLARSARQFDFFAALSKPVSLREITRVVAEALRSGSE